MRSLLRTHWLNLLLIATALGLGGLVLATSRSITSGERITRAQHLVTQLIRERVTAVSLEKPSTQHGPVRLRVVHNPNPVGDEARWQFVLPLQGEAEEATLDQLLRVVQYAKWLRAVAPADVDRAGFGLDAPRSVLGIEQGPLVYRLRLGAPAPSPPGAHYVEVAGEGIPTRGVYVVSASTAADLDPDPSDLRIRQLIPHSGASLERIRVESAAGSFALVRLGRDQFRFEDGFAGARVAQTSLEQMFAEFVRTRAESFLEPERASAVQAELGGRAPAELVKLTLEPRDRGQPPTRITMGGVCPERAELMVVVRHEPRPEAGCIGSNQLPQILARPEWLVDQQLFQARIDELERLVIEQAGKRLELVRTGDAFEMRAPEQGQVESEVVERRFEDLLGLRGRLVPEPSLEALGLAQPTHTVTITKASAEPEPELERLELSVPTPSGVVYARRAADGAVLEFASASLASLNTDALLLKRLQLFDWQAREIANLSVEHEGVSWELAQPSPGSFELRKPEGFNVDGSLAVDWLEAVRQLRAVAWVAAEDTGGFGLDEALLSARVAHVEGKTTGLRVGRRAPRGYYAQLDDRPGVFVLPRSVVDALTTKPIDRSGFMLDPERVRTLRLVADGIELDLERVGPDFVVRSGSIGPAQLTELVDGLSLLRPEAAIRVGPPSERDFAKPVLEVHYTIEREGELVQRHWQVGVADTHRGASVHLARVTGLSATFAIPRQQISRLLDVL